MELTIKSCARAGKCGLASVTGSKSLDMVELLRSWGGSWEVGELRRPRGSFNNSVRHVRTTTTSVQVRYGIELRSQMGQYSVPAPL